MIKRLIFILFLLITFSCSEWLDVNTDPNNPDEVSIENVLPAGISGIAYVVGGRYQVLGSLWAQHWTQSPGASQYQGLDSYDINSTTLENSFQSLYSGALKDLEYVRNEARSTNEWNYYIIATLIQCYGYQLLADLYDQIPFSEALQADEGKFNPKYDDGSEVYSSLIERIDEAISKYDRFNDDVEIPEDEDLLFAGDMDLWLSFAKTLKLKIYLRQIYAKPSVSEEAIRELFEDEETEFLSQHVVFNLFANQTGSRNPVYESEMISLGNNPNLILSNTLASYLIENGDYDRLDVLFNTPENGGEHKALVQGNYNPSDEDPSINSASYSKPYMSPALPVFFFTLAEINLLQVEAIARFNVESYGTARELYNEACESSYLMWGINEGYEQFYSSAGPYAFPSEGSDLEEFIKVIAMQKWIALANIHALEAFFESNRLGYPEISNVPGDNDNYEAGKFTVSVNNVTSGRFPKRLIFPESESSTSGSVVPETKPVWEKIWWDVNN